MFKEPNLKQADLKKFENTSRFLKSDHLRKVDKIKNHMNTFTLNLKDVDLECEWRL